MKELIYVTALTLVFASSVPTAQATGALRDAKADHIVHSAAYPNNAPVPSATYHFALHVVGNALTQLLINLPENISINQGIEIRDQSGQKIDATVSVTDTKAIIVFAQPVSPDKTLEIDMKGIRTSTPQSHVWLFPVSGRSVGMTANIPLGLIRIQTYR